jgi:hypothetical protein
MSMRSPGVAVKPFPLEAHIPPPGCAFYFPDDFFNSSMSLKTNRAPLKSLLGTLNNS